MKYICDTCFNVFPFGTVTDIAGTVDPNINVTCPRCKTSWVPASGSLGHWVDSYPSTPIFFGSGSL